MTTLAKKIEAAYDAGMDSFGVRAMTNHQSMVQIGDEVAHSYHWEDGSSTGDEMVGTCAIDLRAHMGELEDGALEEALESIKAYEGQLVVIGGKPCVDEIANDPGEIVIGDAVVIAIL